MFNFIWNLSIYFIEKTFDSSNISLYWNTRIYLTMIMFYDDIVSVIAITNDTIISISVCKSSSYQIVSLG